MKEYFKIVITILLLLAIALIILPNIFFGIRGHITVRAIFGIYFSLALIKLSFETVKDIKLLLKKN